MPGTSGKFRGEASIRPVGGAGRAKAQAPNPESGSKKQGHLLRDLDERKLEGDPLTLSGRSTEPAEWGGDPYDPLEPTQTIGDRLILRYSAVDGEKIAIGCDDPSEMWFHCEDGKFRWVTRGGLGGSLIGIADMVLNRSATNRPRLFLGVDSAGTMTAHTTLQVEGGIALRVQTNTNVAPAVGDDDYLTLVDTTAGNATITLPSVASCLGRIYVFKKLVAANTLTIDGDGAETIDGAATQAVTNQYHLIKVMAGPTEWHLLHIGAP